MLCFLIRLLLSNPAASTLYTKETKLTKDDADSLKHSQSDDPALKSDD